MEIPKPTKFTNFSERLTETGRNIDKILIDVVEKYKDSLESEVSNVKIELTRDDLSWNLFIKFNINKSIYKITVEIILKLASHQSTKIEILISATAGSETPIVQNNEAMLSSTDDLGAVVSQKINSTLMEITYFDFTNKGIKVDLLAQK